MKFKALFTKGEGVSGTDLLTLEGMLDVRNIRDITTHLRQNLKDCNGLQVKVQNVEKFDLSFLQLLMGLKINFRTEQRPICFDLQLNEESERLLQGSGFAEFLHPKF